MTERKITRDRRALRVYLLAYLYCDYRDIYLQECLLGKEQDYLKAEKTSNFINTIFNGKTTPIDFIKNYNESVNDLIDKTASFKKGIALNLQLFKGMFNSESEIIAFCKNVEHSTYHPLKININFKYQMFALNQYISGNISKKRFLNDIMEVSIFDGSKRSNNRFLKKTFLSVEKTLLQIREKQQIRKQKCENPSRK